MAILIPGNEVKSLCSIYDNGAAFHDEAKISKNNEIRQSVLCCLAICLVVGAEWKIIFHQSRHAPHEMEEIRGEDASDSVACLVPFIFSHSFPVSTKTHPITTAIFDLVGRFAKEDGGSDQV
ncbi:hypothetical protein V6N13_074153 [Hibiscus sabdariffa]